MKHAVKAVKEKNVHLEISNCECKLLTSNFEEISSIIQVYLYIKVLPNMLIGSTSMRNFLPLPSYT